MWVHYITYVSSRKKAWEARRCNESTPVHTFVHSTCLDDIGVHGSDFGSPSAQAFKSPHKGTGNSKKPSVVMFKFR